MSRLKSFLSAFALIAVLAAVSAQAGTCPDILKSFENVSLAANAADFISKKELVDHVLLKIPLVLEFRYMREEAQKMGLRVWLFGGTASSFLHYVKWDLKREKGVMDLQKDRFDYDFTNIFRSTQDLDIVVDAAPEVARQFQGIIAKKFPHFLGAKANKWEVRTLKHRIGRPGELGFKEALLNDADFNNQNTDSNSLGMVEITSNSKGLVVRDLKSWSEARSIFLEDTLNNHISFFRSPRHFTTSRAKLGENPEILSVIRLLVKAFQYELGFSKEDFDQMKAVVREFDPRKVKNDAALRRINDTDKKLVMHAVNKLDELGLRKKLISMGSKDEIGSSSWWLNREPLKSRPVGEGRGKTAKQLNIKVVAHETNSFLAYESITRAHSGEPNVLISRQNAAGESAAYGDGFYTRLGRVGARGTGLTIRFTVDPSAREGSDFTVNGEIIVFKNKRALKVIQESLNFGLDDLLRLAESNQEAQVDHSDLGLLEKLKRRLNAAKITDELDRLLNSSAEKDHDRLVQILSAFQSSSISKLISEDVLASVVKNIYSRVAQMAHSSSESDILKYVRTVGPILKTVDSVGLLRATRFIDYLERLSQSKTASFDLRKEAVFEILLSVENFKNQVNFKKDLSEPELAAVKSEIREWHKSPDARKRKVAVELNKKWSEAIENGNVNKLEALIDSGIFDINHKNLSQVSMLQLAGYYKQRAIIDWLVANPEFDFNAKNKLGITEVEQLRLSGRCELADAIEQGRPEVRARRFKVRERNTDQKTAEYPNGTPIIDFVRIEPNSFMRGEAGKKVLTEVSKPFEIMSVDVPQEMYRVVADLIKQHLRGEYNVLSSTPSNFKGKTRPVEQVSYDDSTLWKKGLNELSKVDAPQVQQTLRELFPGHKQGKQYSRATEAQWDLVLELGGIAESDYSHGKGEADLGDYAGYSQNSNSTQPVGSKKPVFYNGKPLYDLHGNVWKWLEDSWDGSLPLPSGTDPIGSSGSDRVMRGGSWFNDAQVLRSAGRDGFSPGGRYNFVGFRLVRTAE